MKSTAYLILVLASVALAGCGEVVLPGSDNRDQEEYPIVPPSGIRATIPAEFPEIEEARLRQLALEPADLPAGFELQYEDAMEEEGVIFYVAHYFNEQVSSDEELLEADVPLTIDVVVVLFDDEAASVALYKTLESMSPEDFIQYTQTQRHWSAEDLGFEQVDVQVVRVPFREFGDGTLAWQTSETVRHPETDTQLTFVDVAVCIRRGRALAMVDIGRGGQPAPTADVETLAAKLDERLAIALR